jgi:hypothetical protein
MAFATFSGPVRVGTVRENAGRNTGLVTLTQAFDTGVVATVGNSDNQLGILPQGAQILNIRGAAGPAGAGDIWFSTMLS